MIHDQISEGRTYAGLRGVRRTVTKLARIEPWFSVPSIKRRNCTYTTTTIAGKATEYTVRVDCFAKWANCDVTTGEEQ
jgi:hypothetical protein